MTAALFTNRGRSGIFATLGLVGVLGAASVFVQMARDERYHTDKPAEQILYVRSVETMRRMVLSYDALAADIYWVRALQHFGGQRQKLGTEPKFELLYPLLDLATSLDPRFNIAYRFGSLFLAEPPPGGPGQPDLAIALLRKGIKENPHKWQYYQDAGFVYYFQYKDYGKAAEWFRRGSEIEGAPWFLKSLAANTLAKGEDRRASRLLYQTIVETADNDFMRNDALRRLRQLDTMDDIDVLRQVVRRYREHAPGAQAITWQTLIAARILRMVPRDRDGFDLKLDPVTGDIGLETDSPLFPLPTETPDEAESATPAGMRPIAPRPVRWPSPTGVPPMLEAPAPPASFAP
jgi:tetratricopeptide (TPR) repeat protein